MWQSIKQTVARTRTELSRKFPSFGRRANRQHVFEPPPALAAAVALVGYAWPLAFPLVAVYLLSGLFGTLLMGHGSWRWAQAGVDGAVILLCVWITVSLLRLKTDTSAVIGVEIETSEAPLLFKQLATLYDTFGVRPVRRVFLTGDMEIAMTYVPVNGFPFLCRRQMCIGLPLLAALSPEAAKGALARVIGQSSLRRNRLTGWLHRQYHIWSRYEVVYRLQAREVRWPLQLCFQWYVWLFTKVARPTIRRDELAGDRYALDTINDADLVNLIAALTVYPRLLRERFWPPFQRLARKYPNPPMGPYSRLVKSLPTLLQPGEGKRWLADALSRGGNGIHPALAERLHNIGHNDVNLPTPPAGAATAAAKLLGNALPALCARLDKAWLRECIGDWRTRHAKYRDELNLLKQLSARAQNGILEPREAWMYARLVAKHQGKAAAVPLFKRLIQEDPNNARHLIEAGRLLLSCNEAVGITALEHAMALDQRYTDQAVRLIAAYGRAQVPRPTRREVA